MTAFSFYMHLQPDHTGLSLNLQYKKNLSTHTSTLKSSIPPFKMNTRSILSPILLSLTATSAIIANDLRVHTIGDSTMADYAENTTRTRGWGEMFQEFFTDSVSVFNYARGGRSSRSFYEEGLWDKVRHNILPGDYVLIQFAHNDEKEGGKDGNDLRGTAPWTTYRSYLEKYIDETRDLGGRPVLVTPIVRRYFDNSGKITPKGCHDLGNADDSILNYVRVMKHVGRIKNAPIVDMTALTKSFVESLGPDSTIKKIYVPTDGTHTQATGAAIYASIAAKALSDQGILDEYLNPTPPLVLNPRSLDLGTVYVGDKTSACFDVTGLKLSPKKGTLTLRAPEGMGISVQPYSAPSREISIPYDNGSLWNTSLFLHFNPLSAESVESEITLTNGHHRRSIPVKAISREIKNMKDTVIYNPHTQLNGLKEQSGFFTTETGLWPSDIDESANRYVELIVRNDNTKQLLVREISLTLDGALSYRIAYARGKDFYPRTDLAECQNNNNHTRKLSVPVNTTEIGRAHV